MQSILPQPAGFTQPRGPLLLTIQGGGKEQPALVLSWRECSHMLPYSILYFPPRTPWSLLPALTGALCCPPFLNLSLAMSVPWACGEPRSGGQPRPRACRDRLGQT